MEVTQSYNRNQIRLRAVAFEEVSVGAASTPLTASLVKDAWEVILRVEDAPIRFRLDGGVPTATVGYPAFIGDQIPLQSRGSESEASRFRAIRQGSTNARLSVHYYANQTEF